MWKFFLIGLILFFLKQPIYAQNSCKEPETLQIKVYNKAISLYDTVIPMLFQDPERSIQFHIRRSQKLYQQARETSKTNPGVAIRLAIRGQHHLTLLEKNIRQLQNPSNTLYTQILFTLKTISLLQKEILSNLPEPCIESLSQLQSFEIRTESVIKKLYYENLLQ